MEPFQVELEMNSNHFEHATTQQNPSCPMSLQLVHAADRRDREQVLIVLMVSQPQTMFKSQLSFMSLAENYAPKKKCTFEEEEKLARHGLEQ